MSNGLDTLSWIRLCWAWMIDPKTDWRHPDEALCKLHPAVAVADCKSMYDLVTKNTTAKCEEQRTALECLLIKERLSEGVRFRWLPTDAMISDCLTKVMEGKLFRDVLRTNV